MRRRRLHRILALPLALWFVALATDVGGLDACPMHDGMAHMAMGQMAGMAAGDMSGTAMGDMSGMTPAPAAPRAPQPHGPMQCTCMGACCGCAMATLPAGPAAVLPVLVAIRQAVSVERALRAPMRPAAHRQPPAIGPPALHTT
jgi:hypothetical protein